VSDCDEELEKPAAGVEQMLAPREPLKLDECLKRGRGRDRIDE
jgi:hypothetical protein